MSVLIRLLITALVVNVGWQQALAQSQAAGGSRFEVASIKINKQNDGVVSLSNQGGRFTGLGVSLGLLIRNAYQVQEFQIVNGPSWIDSERFDVAAKEPDGTPRTSPGGGPTPQQLMMRALLADRFGLVVRRETRELPVFALVLARKDASFGSQMRRSTTDCSPPAAGRAAGAVSQWQQPPCGTSVGPGFVLAGARTMAQIATALSQLTNTGSSLNRFVVDRTGLDGTFDINLRFTPDRIPNFGPGGPPNGMPPIDPNGPSIFTAVQEQLGLKLESQRGPVEVLVIEKVSRPTED
jgi:uncharacterized protein (TIGR03435 family)